jgi:hypothetical protein
MTKLFVFGCSFTKGSGCLEGEPYTLKYKKSDKDLIWPEILAEELNLKLYNFGEPGKSNGRIIDSIIENFELIQKDDFVLIQKTFPYRFEVPFRRKNLQEHLFTITPQTYKLLLDEGYSKEEANVLQMMSVINDNTAFHKKTTRLFNFIKKSIINKGARMCIIWDLMEYEDKYQIIQQADKTINDAHWSYEGHRMFAEEIINNIKYKKII